MLKHLVYLPCARNGLRERSWTTRLLSTTSRLFDDGPQPRVSKSYDPRLDEFGSVLENDFAELRAKYRPAKYPILLAHGLLGFDELHLGGSNIPGVQYWRGIREALAAKNIEVITASVPASATIEDRARALAHVCELKAPDRPINIIAHSMGGLDSRYMISRLQSSVKVASLTTIATPHRGSAFADFIFDNIGVTNLPRIYKILNFFGMETGAFQQLTQKYMTNDFNVHTPDLESVRYFSYGASFTPSILSVFRQSHAILAKAEGPNDGLVSVASSQWGKYKGTLTDHAKESEINWTNRMRWFFWTLVGNKRKYVFARLPNFNAIAFYLSIVDMLAEEGL